MQQTYSYNNDTLNFCALRSFHSLPTRSFRKTVRWRLSRHWFSTWQVLCLEATCRSPRSKGHPKTHVHYYALQRGDAHQWDDLTYVLGCVHLKVNFNGYVYNSKKTASDRCIHIHSCTRSQKQNEAHERIDWLFPRMDSNCPFQCNEDLSSAQRSEYSRHLTQHIANRANKAGHDGWQCGVVINGNAICSDRFVFYSSIAFFSLTSWYDSFVTKNDHRVHLQEEHHISAAVGLVEFCYWCQEWWVFRW